MNLKMTPKEIAKVIDGKIVYIKSDRKIKDFSTDTRTLKKGDVFWALKGKRFDGNDFIHDAINKGARGIIASKRIDLFGKVEFYILVDDTLNALHKLAQYHIKKLNIKTISVTGSNGKTTTKEIIKNILSSHVPTISNPGNLNNEYGLPLSVLEAEEKHKYAVFEIGSSSIGEVKKLSKIIMPNIAVITTIAPEHMEFFKNMKNVFLEETSVIDSLKPNGKIIINGDNRYLKKLKNLRNAYSYGFKKYNDLVIVKKPDGFLFLFDGKYHKIKMKEDILHNYLNAACGFIVGKILRIPEEKIVNSICKFNGVALRMEVIKRKNSVIILDAYNANPQSMEYAIREISKRKPFALILGDMKELGDYSYKAHLNLAKMIEKTKPEYVILVGKEIKFTFDYLKEKIKNLKYYLTTESAMEYVDEFIRKNQHLNILIKASRSMQFERFLNKNEN